MHDARCEGCGRTGRIPDPDRRYRCKECGGAIVALRAAESDDPLSTMSTCPSCSAMNPEDDVFCSECGEPLPATEGEAGALDEVRTAEQPGSTRDPSPSAEDKAERLHAARQMADAKKTLASVRMLFGLGAFLYLGLFAVLLLATPEIEEEQARSVVWVASGVVALAAVLALVGAWRVIHEPLLWCLALAGVSTLDLALRLSAGQGIGWPMIVRILWTLGLWAVVVQVARVRAHILAHPDLWHALKHHHRRDTLEQQLEDGEPIRARSRRRVRAGRMPLWKIAALVVVVIAVTCGLWALITWQPPLDGAVTGFRDAWQATDFDGVTTRMGSERMVDSFRRVVARRGWDDALPPLDEGQTDRHDELRAVVRFLCDGGELRTSWELRDGRWVIRQLRFPSDH